MQLECLIKKSKTSKPLQDDGFPVTCPLQVSAYALAGHHGLPQHFANYRQLAYQSVVKPSNEPS